ncbi:RNA 3'-terminal phosphate cyclase [Uliginosibacterium sp. TH139]|uniref:RNA 3'-terminal phosphate cyclase n=1 Tax=Uliginosibacterium sp. TH139 TaxID=2067453 RepID=UPI000C7C52DB|nr:RNA 3'-terminal phosphate cyclase [Uliginosibacterium sp. TH139]PLK50527.1 RNA 3'-terminal phosphate cyclase [Uliginosibacterium sp. TH139]
MNMIELDGSQGEGGGQILRTALTLSMITGTPFRIERIRAKRSKPGLLRQHLTAVKAAAEICGAQVEGAEAGSLSLSFVPGRIRGGDYRYAIGTAGSCTLVLQTVLPALWFADAPSTVTLSGGTHNSAAPPADFLQRAWLPLMLRMGVQMELELLRHGFYPAGGGELQARVQPLKALQPLHLSERGELLQARATAIVAGVPGDVAKRELDTLNEALAGALGEVAGEIRGLSSREGPGNALLLELQYAGATELFTAFGEKGLPAQTVACRLAQEVVAFHRSNSAVGEHLADQLLLPIALAGAGSFCTSTLSSHLQTNIEVIQKFLPVEFSIAAEASAHRIALS